MKPTTKGVWWLTPARFVAKKCLCSELGSSIWLYKRHWRILLKVIKNNMLQKELAPLARIVWTVLALLFYC
ncbi:MAG: hypothetical protein V4706_11705 [Pseudomonadota bacterium]